MDDTELALEIVRRGLAGPAELEECRRALALLRARGSSATFIEVLLDRRILGLAQLEEIRNGDASTHRLVQKRIFEELQAAEAPAAPPPARTPTRGPILPSRLRRIAAAAGAGCLILLVIVIFRLASSPSASPAGRELQAKSPLAGLPPILEAIRPPGPDLGRGLEPNVVRGADVSAPAPAPAPAFVPVPEVESSPVPAPVPGPEREGEPPSSPSVPGPEVEASPPPPAPRRERLPEQWRAWFPVIFPADDLPRREVVRLRDGRILAGELCEVDANGIALRVGEGGAPRRLEWEKIGLVERARIGRVGPTPLLDDGWVEGIRVVTEVRTVEGVFLREDGETLWVQSADAARPVAIARRAILAREPVRLPEHWALSPGERLDRRIGRVARGDAEGWLRMAAMAVFLGVRGRSEELLARAQGAGADGAEIAAVREVVRVFEALSTPIDRDWARSSAVQRDRYLTIRRVGRIGHPAALLLLLHLVGTEQTSVGRVAAILGVREMNRREAVAPLIAMVRRLTDDGRDAVLDTLTALTGVERATFEAWRDWWRENGQAWLDGRFVVRGPLHAAGSTRLFYGLPIDANRLVFTVDVSGSMADIASYSELRMILSEIPASHDGIIRRIDVARWQLRRVLRSLPVDARFNLVLFQTEPRVYAASMLEASRQNIAKAIEVVDGVEPGGGTDILRALEKSFELVEPEEGAVYLISDGLPSSWSGGVLPAAVAEMKRRGRNGRIRVHTAFIAAATTYEFDLGKQLMAKIAEATGGKFVCLGSRPQ